MSAQVYFARATDGTGPIKIGVSLCPQTRVDQLSRGRSPRLRMLATIAGDCWLERRFHQRFLKDRVRGEWFTASPDLLETIGAINANIFSEAALPSLEESHPRMRVA